MKKLMVVMLTLCLACGADEVEQAGGTVSVLFLGKGENQPLIVGLGGSEGGNAWASLRSKAIRDMFVDQGYAFLAVGYFGAEGTPEKLDRVSIDKVHDTIEEALKDPKIADDRIAVIGGSKGAELALLLGSHYTDVSCVVSVVGSHAAFPALTFSASTSSWTYEGKEVPYVPANWASVPSIIKGNLRRAFEIMMEDTAAVDKALIQVEKINGPILCVSASKDEMWPSTEMSSKVMKRLDDFHFPYVHQHIIIQGDHNEPLDHFDQVLAFITKNYPLIDHQ